MRVLVAVRPRELRRQEQRRVADSTGPRRSRRYGCVPMIRKLDMTNCCRNPDARLAGFVSIRQHDDGNDDEQRHHDPADQLRAARLRPFVRRRPDPARATGRSRRPLQPIGRISSRDQTRMRRWRRSTACGGRHSRARHPEGEAQHEREVRAGGVDVSHVRRIPVADARFVKRGSVAERCRTAAGRWLPRPRSPRRPVPPAATSRAPDAGARARSRPW